MHTLTIWCVHIKRIGVTGAEHNFLTFSHFYNNLLKPQELGKIKCGYTSIVTIQYIVHVHLGEWMCFTMEQ